MGYLNSTIDETGSGTGASGPPGPQGPPGPKGKTALYGPPGSQGPTGPDGAHGPTGPQGPPGAEGPAGDYGQTGSKGDRGEKGDKGDRGEKGDKGDPGPRGLEGPRGTQGLRGPQGLQGPQGPTGTGGDPTFLATKLDKNVDINMQGKYGILGLKSNLYPVQGDLDKAISYADQRKIFLSKKEGGKMENAINMNDNTIYNVRDPEPRGVDQATNKRYVDTQLTTKLDKVADIDMKNHSITNLDLPSNPRHATCVEYVNYRINTEAPKYVKVDGNSAMAGNFNLNDKKIINLNTDDKDIKSAANVDYVSNKVNTAKGDVTVVLKNYFVTKKNESHITSSTNKKDASRYLMENADESSSENNIRVTGIVDFPGSPHTINKKSIQLHNGKNAQNNYFSRIGFNMFKLPEGEYTLAIEFFPPSTTNLSVSVVSTSLNINQHATKLFVNYSRSIVHLHKWSITPPEYIYIDMHCQGTASSPTQGIGYMIVYGVKGSQNDVDSSVYDTAYVIENGKMVMQTDYPQFFLL